MMNLGDFATLAAMAGVKLSSSPSAPGIVPGAPATLLLVEGDNVKVAVKASSAGSVTVTNSAGIIIDNKPLVANQKMTFGPYAGTQTVVVAATAGSIDASVENAAPTTRQDILQRLRNLDRVGYYPVPASPVTIATVTGDWSGANAPVAVAAGAISNEQILPVSTPLQPGDIPIVPTPPSALASGLSVHTYRWVSANSVGIRFRNTSGGSLTPPAGTWTINVARWANGVPPDVPHVTLSAAGAASQVGASGVIQTILGDSGKIRMRHPVVRDSSYGGTYVYPSQSTPLSGNRQGSVCCAEWMTDSPKFELSFVGNRSNIQIYVDGKCVTPAPLNLALDMGVGYRVLVDFTQGGTLTNYVRKQRKIRMEMSCFGSTAWFGGVTLLKSDSISLPTNANPVRGVIFGDSFVEGKSPAHPIATNITPQNDGFANRLGDLLGWDECIVCGVGGTGYLSDTGGTAKKFGDRIADITGQKPDVVVVFGSINDSSFTAAAVQAAVTAFHTQLVAELPNAQIFVAGVQTINNASSSLAALNTAVKNGVAAVNSSNLSFIDMFSPTQWVTGTGKSDAKANDGNADWITGPDNTHPTWEGHNFYAYKMAEAVREAIKSLLARA